VEGRLSRAELVGALVGLIAARRPEHVLRVAVDGPDAAGKTTLADELAGSLVGRREVIRVGIDGFHRPRSVRLRRGSLSPEGFYHDSFDYAAVRRAVLDPLGPGGDLRYRTAVFDYRVDAAVEEPIRVAPEGAVLLFDGVFMLRPELRAAWDLSIFVDVSAEVALRRAMVRDVAVLGGPSVVRERYERRYLPGQRLYRVIAEPELAADVVIDNDDPTQPRVVKWSV
jgi:uridine kinase